MSLRTQLRRVRNQTAVWWSSTGKDHYGNNTYAEPMEIKCRWDEIVGEFRNARQEVFVSRATVIVDRDMKVGDILKLGEADSDLPSDPESDDNAFVIQAWSKVPDRKAREFLRRAFL